MNATKLKSLGAPLILLILGGLATLLISAKPGHAPWGYEGEIGPEHWGDLDSAYALCRDGASQSPVDLVATTRRTNNPIEIHWSSSALNLVNNGHTIQANYDAGSYVMFEGVRYELLQFHFHRKSEHTKHGKHYPMEAHFVHRSASGDLLVIGVLLKRSLRANPLLGEILSMAPMQSGESVEGGPQIAASEFLPERPYVYHYDGSLTTPPGTEGVKWFVFMEPSDISSGQVSKFSKLYPNNFRPVQPLNDRVITQLHATRG